MNNMRLNIETEDIVGNIIIRVSCVVHGNIFFIILLIALITVVPKDSV